MKKYCPEQVMFIYGLYEITNEGIEKEIRYVGQTHKLQERLCSHKNSHINNSNQRLYVNRWIKKVYNSGSIISMKIIENCFKHNCDEREKYWISEYRKTNKLTNLTDGGQGTSGYSRFEISYEDCKSWVKNNLNIKSLSEWNKNKKNLPKHIPKNPNEHFLNNGWISWGDFLDSGFISTVILSQNHLTYENAKIWISKNLQHIQTRDMWNCSIKNSEIPSFIPSIPERFYKTKNRGWKGWGDFLGTGNKSGSAKHSKYLPYEGAREWINENFPNIINYNDWKKNYASKNIFPSFIPKCPQISYKIDRTWRGWRNFLDNYTVPHSNVKHFYLYKDAINFLNSNNFKVKNATEYRKMKKSNILPMEFPLNPNKFYEKSGWVSWYMFLGIKNIGFYSYEELKKINKENKIVTNREYRLFRNESKDSRMPSCPQQTHKSAWKGADDFFNKEEMQEFLRPQQFAKYCDNYQYKTSKDYK